MNHSNRAVNPKIRKAQKPMSGLQKFILAVLGVIAACLFVVIGLIFYQYYATYWDVPLGPALNLPTLSASSPTLAAASVSPAFTSTPGGITYLPTVTPPPTFTPNPLLTTVPTPVQLISCGGTGVMTILAIGTDARSNSYNYGLADVIRVVRVDFSNRRVAVLEFPRDLWVEIPEISDNLNGQDHEKLNQAYLYGNPGFGYWDDPSAGPGLLARTMQLNFGVQPDHYIAVNMRTFEQIVNAVDGIEINVPNEDVAHNTGLHIGNHHLDGGEALKVARNRQEGVFERADNQNRVLCALRDKLVSPSVMTRIPEIVNSFTDNVQTDLTPGQISQLACLGTQISPEWILFASFPQELFKATRVRDPVFDGRVFVWDANFNFLRGYVNMFNAGTWPTPEPSEDDGESIPFCPPPGQ